MSEQAHDDDVAIIQLYRAFAGVESTWRQRLDVTANWAVPLVLALVTLALSEPSVPHLALLVLGWALIALAALVEARRYRILHHAAWRTGLIERGFYAPLLEEKPTELGGWKAALAADLRRPALRITRWDAFRARFRATYAVLAYLLTLAWIAKLVSHPTITTSLHEVLERMAVRNVVPSWVVLAAALSILAAATAVALTSSSAQALETKARRKARGARAADAHAPTPR